MWPRVEIVFSVSWQPEWRRLIPGFACRDHIRCITAMSLLIDGYNLMHAAGIFGRGRGTGTLERSRRALLDVLVESIEPAELPRSIIVFDASQAPPGLPRVVDHKGLSVRFASSYDSADELLEELIQQDTTPRKLTVVSSDHRVQRAAQKRKATAIDSDRWFRELLERRRQRNAPHPTSPAKPLLADDEVAFWLREFGALTPSDKDKDVDELAGDVFPDELLDELEDEEEA